MEQDQLLDTVKTVMAKVWEITPDMIPNDANPGNLQKWDSLHHMNFILALEEHFLIRFNDEEVVELTNLPKIVEAISKRKAN
jgi:acyl carrier protein